MRSPRNAPPNANGGKHDCLDTNLLIDLVTVGSPHIATIRDWLVDGEKLGASAIAWSEFCNGPHSREQKDAVFALLEKRVADFTPKQARGSLAPLPPHRPPPWLPRGLHDRVGGPLPRRGCGHAKGEGL